MVVEHDPAFKMLRTFGKFALAICNQHGFTYARISRLMQLKVQMAFYPSVLKDHRAGKHLAFR